MEPTSQSADPPPAAPPQPTPQQVERQVEREIMARLAAPFPPDLVEWRPGGSTKDGKKAQALAYVDARVVQNRLDEVLGFNWDSDPYGIGDHHVCCRITITLPSGKRVTRGDGCWVGNVEVTVNRDGKVESKDEDRADREAKWALSDAFKRAAVKFGVAKYLYNMPTPYRPINEFKKFDDAVLQELRSIAAKPYEKWQAAREERSRGKGGGNGAPAPAAPPRQDPPRFTPTPNGSAEPTSATTSPPAGAPAQPAAAPPSTPAQTSAASGGSSGDTFIDRIVREAEALQNEGEFHRFVGRTRDTFTEGTPERKRYADAVKAAATRLGVKPKGKEQRR